ncbi:hypothetical protein b3_0146 [Synechococcus phage B3]|nr:hypothetical protein b3_0146 [Synechococcus phage B3]QGT54760.1 hypothetical protein b23_0145 [Synechococcus phage B23]
MKPFIYYSSPTTKHPDKKSYTTIYVTDKGQLVWQGPEKSFNGSLYLNKSIQRVFDEAEYIKHRNQHVEELRKLETEFRHDVFVAHGVQNNPKKNICFNLAWERSRSEGCEAVYDTFGDLVVLIE